MEEGCNSPDTTFLEEYMVYCVVNALKCIFVCYCSVLQMH